VEETLQEHFFFSEEEIKISSTRIELPNKVIAMHTVSSIKIDKEEIKPPWIMIIGSIVSLLIWIFNPNTEAGLTGLSIGSILIIIAGLYWYLRQSGRNEAVVINLTSGETEYIDNQDVQDIQKVFTAISDAIIFRG
jgi:hypothetical protein